MSNAVVSKILYFILWLIISVVVSYVFEAMAPSGLVGGHEGVISTCVINPKDIEVQLQDIGGLEKAKEELYFSLLLPLKNPRVFFTQRGPFSCSKGIMLTGPPGCGKTMMMKAVAKSCNCCFICPTMATLQSKFYGESQKLLRSMFDVAKKKAPCILFIDEIDAAFRTRSEDDAGCDYTLKTEFLSMMDGLRSNAGDAVVVVGATNNPDALDPALKRRLPVVIQIGLPTAAERKKIVSLLCAHESSPLKCVEEFEAVSDTEADGFSGSDMTEVYRCASRNRLRTSLQMKSLSELTNSLPPIHKTQWLLAIKTVRNSKKTAAVSYCSRASAMERLVQALGGKDLPQTKRIESIQKSPSGPE